MTKLIRRILKVIAIVAVVLVAIALVAINVMFARYDEMKTVEQIESAGIPVRHATIPFGDNEISAWCIGDTTKQKALFIHGSPGHWVDWAELYTDKDLLASYCLIAYDRPGYGGTTVPASGQLSVQADVATAVMEHFCSDNECYSVVGHSYGGGVVEEVLLNHGSFANTGIYVAGTLSPDLQKRKWYNYIAAFRPVQWIIPHAFVASNIEMMVLGKELEKNRGLQPEISQPITLIQGTSDVLVSYKTVDYYKKVKPNGVTYVIVDGMNHFTPWTDPDIIVKALVN